MLVSGKEEPNKDKEQKLGQMDIYTKENFKIVNGMEKAH